MLAYERLGTGDPLVLLHALGGARTEWRPVQFALAARHEVIAVDLPGHGGSGGTPNGQEATPAGLARSVAATLDGFGLSQAHLAGNSLGAWVALELAALGRARTVTAFAPAGLWDPATCNGPVHDGLAPLRRLARLTGPVLPQLTRIRPLARAAVAMAVAHPERVARRTVADAALALGAAVGYRAILETLRLGRVPDSDRVRCPLSVVFGELDRQPPAWQSFDRLPAHAQVDVWSGVGHMVVWDAPERASRLVLRTTGALD